MDQAKKEKILAIDATAQVKETEVTIPDKYFLFYLSGPTSFYVFKILDLLNDEETVKIIFDSLASTSCSDLRSLYCIYKKDIHTFYNDDFFQRITEANLILMMSNSKLIWRAVIYILGHGENKWIPSAHFIAESLRLSSFYLPEMYPTMDPELKKHICLYIYSIFGEGYYSNVIPPDNGPIYKENDDVLGRFIAFVRKDDLFDLLYFCSESKMQTWVVLMEILSNIYHSDILRAWFYKHNQNWVFEQDAGNNDVARQQNVSMALKIHLSITKMGDKTLDTDDWRIFQSYAETDNGLANNFTNIKSEDDILNDLDLLFKLRVPQDDPTRGHFVQYWNEIRFGHFLRILPPDDD
jgi:hypothetical protein